MAYRPGGRVVVLLGLFGAFVIGCRQEGAAPTSVFVSQQLVSSVVPTSGGYFTDFDGSSFKVVGRVKPGEVFQVEFSGLVSRFREITFTLYDRDEKPLADLLSDRSEQPGVGMKWVWSGNGGFTVLAMSNFGPTSKLILPTPLDPGRYNLCSTGQKAVCAPIDVVA